jgi:hypothetical protein
MGKMTFSDSDCERELQFHPMQWKAVEDITDLLNAVRQCKSYQDYYSAQQQLGQHIDKIDALVEEAGVRCKHFKRQLRRYPYQKPIQQMTTEQKIDAQLQQAVSDYTLYTRLSRQYRMVGDALAWQLYGFQTLPIYALGLNQSHGPISSSQKKGIDKEIEEVERLWNEQGVFALRHDYTNNVRVWDLSIFYPDETGIEEIKVNGRSVETKQKRLGQVVADLMKNDKYTRPDNEQFVHRKLSSGIAHTNLTLLRQAILQSKERSIGYMANSYLTVTVIDLLNPANRTEDDLLNEWAQKTQGGISPDIWPIWCADILTGNSRGRLVQSEPGFAVPYTVYPLFPDYIAAIITGFVRVHYQLNTTAIVRAFQDKGFEAECLLRQNSNQAQQKNKVSYFRVRRGNMTLTIHALPIEQMLFDGLPLEELVASITDHFDSVNDTQGITPKDNKLRFHGMSSYASMDTIWSTSPAYVFLTALESS